MLQEQKTTSRNGVFFSVMRGGLLAGGKEKHQEGDFKDDQQQLALFCVGKGLLFINWLVKRRRVL